MSKARSGRFAGERSAAFVALNSSLALDWRLWPEDIEGSVAHARALRRAGVITDPDLGAIEEGLARVAGEIESGAFVPRDDDEDVHMAIERRLTELVGAPAAKLHTGRSRNDQVVTDVRLHLRRVIEGQREALRGLQMLLLARAEPHLETVMPAYTHLQRAQVTSLAHHLLAWFWMLERDRDRFAVALDACLELPLGAGAAAGLNYDLDRAAVAAELGFERIAPNSLDAVADRDFACDYLAAAATLAAHLSRIGAEIVLWATAEFGFVALPDAVSGGSSIMPQKRNPDAAELMRAAGPRVAADLQGLLATPARPAARLQHRPARRQALPVRRRRLPRGAPAGRGRAAGRRDVRHRAHGGGLRLVSHGHRRGRRARRPGPAVPRGPPRHRRLGAPLPREGLRARRAAAR